MQGQGRLWKKVHARQEEGGTGRVEPDRTEHREKQTGATCKRSYRIVQTAVKESSNCPESRQDVLAGAINSKDNFVCVRMRMREVPRNETSSATSVTAQRCLQQLEGLC